MQLDKYVAGLTEDVALTSHIASCPGCRATIDDLRANNALLDQVKATDITPDSIGGLPSNASAAVSIDGYAIGEEIHRGAQGIVFRATQLSANRTVALKLLLAGAFATSLQRRRFEREIELVAGLDHPNLVTVFDSGVTASGQLYFAMQLVDGDPLGAWTNRMLRNVRPGDRKRVLRDALQFLIKVCDAVNHAHRHGVIHRDLKPANILVDSRGEPHVVDFGLARVVNHSADHQSRDMTQPGIFMGTAAYASPEQVSGDPARIDIRSDVYSLGIVLYEMVTGSLPIDESHSLSDVIRAITELDVPRPSSRNRSGLPIDRDLETIMMKAVARNRERRYQSAAALGEDLERYLAGQAINARRDSRWYVIRKTIAQHKAAAVVIISFVALLAASSIAMTMLYRRAAGETHKVRTINVFLEDTIASIEPSEPGTPTMLDFFDEARHWVELVLGDDPDAESTVRLIVGNGYRNLGRFADAERELSRSLEIRRMQYGEHRVEFAKGVNALGQLRFSEGRLDDAEQLISHALQIRIDQLGSQSLDVALNQGLLARVYVAQGNLDGAEELLRQSLETRRMLLDDDHPDVAMALFSLAQVVLEQGYSAQSLELHRQALQARRNTLHELHPDLARSLLAVGRILVDRHRAKEALPLLQEAVSLRMRALHAEHWRVAEAQCELAVCLARLDDREEADAVHAKAMAVLMQTLGRDDPMTVQSAQRFAAMAP